MATQVNLEKGAPSTAATLGHPAFENVPPAEVLSDNKSSRTPTLTEEINVFEYDQKRRSKYYRWTIVVLAASFYAIANIAVGIVAPATPQILSEFGLLSDTPFYSTLLVTIWGFGQAVGPLCIGPLTEKYGRLWLQHGSSFLFILFSIIGALSTNIHMLIGLRFLMALTNVASALTAPIIGDLFPTETCGTAIAVGQVVAMLGTGIGPVAGGFLTLAVGWRWTFWFMAIITAAVEIPLLILYRESYLPKLIRNQQIKTAKLKEHDRPISKPKQEGKKSEHRRDPSVESQAQEQETRTYSGVDMDLLPTLIRPFKILIFSPAVLLVTIYVSYLYGVGYTFFATIVPVFIEVYGFSTEASGFSYFGATVGLVIGALYCVYCTKYLVTFCRRQFPSSQGQLRPEHYIAPMVPAGVLMPIGLFIYGWAAERALPWIVCFIGIGVAMVAVSVSMVVSNNYLVQAFGDYAASASSISIALRFITGAVLPLASPALFRNLGYGWGNSVYGFISLLFVPAPVFMIIYGEWLRGLGPYAFLRDATRR